MRHFILNIVAIIVVLGIGFLSQNSYKIQETSNSNQINVWWSGVQERVASEAQKRGGELVEETETQKNNFAQSLWQGMKSYLAKNFNYLFKTTVE